MKENLNIPDRNLTPDQINAMTNKSLETVKQECAEIFAKMKETKMKGGKIVSLQQEVAAAKSVASIQKLLYNAYLAGNGMSVTGSSYQKRSR